MKQFQSTKTNWGIIILVVYVFLQLLLNKMKGNYCDYTAELHWGSLFTLLINYGHQIKYFMISLLCSFGIYGTKLLFCWKRIGKVVMLCTFFCLQSIIFCIPIASMKKISSPWSRSFVALNCLVLILKNHSFIFSLFETEHKESPSFNKRKERPDERSTKSKKDPKEPTKRNTQFHAENSQSFYRGHHQESLEHFIIYLVAPTVIYKKDYRITDRVRIKRVLLLFLGLLLSIFVLFFTVTNMFHKALVPAPLFENFIPTLFCTATPTIISWLAVSLGLFYFFLQLSAEISRFPERNFAGMWMKDSSLSNFWRLWNKSVHDFLLYHVYIPARKYLGMNRLGAVLIVFIISAFFHEYVLFVGFTVFKGFTLIAFLTQPFTIAFQKQLKPMQAKVFGMGFIVITLIFLLPFLEISYFRGMMLNEIQ